MNINDKIQICKVVAQAILADGQITDSEHTFINELMDKYKLTNDQKKDVMARNVGDDVAELAKDLTAYESKNELMVDVAMAVAADGDFSSSEKEMLDQIAAALGIEKADMDMLVKNALM